MKPTSPGITAAALRWLYRLATNRLPPEHQQSLRAFRRLLAGRQLLMASFSVTNLLVGVFECVSMALLAVVLQLLLGNGAASPGAGRLGSVPGSLQEALGPERLVPVLLGGAIVLQLLRSGLQFAGEAMGAWLQTGVTEAARGRLLRHVLGMDYQEFGRHKLGRLQSYFEQVNHVGLLLGYVCKLMTQLSVVAAYVVLLLWISGAMTLAAVVVLAVLSWPVARVVRRVKRAGSDYVRASAAASEHVAECLQGFRPLHTFGLLGHVLARAEVKFRDCGRAQRRKLIGSAVIPPLFEAVCIGGGLSLLLAAYCLTRDSGGQVLAQMIGFTLVLYRLMPRINHLNTYLAAVASVWPSMQRLAPFLGNEPHRASPGRGLPVPADWDGIRFEDVSFRHGSAGREAVSGLSCTIPRRGMTAVVGTSGAGKSTLANLLLRFYEPSAGRVLVGGVDLRHIDREAWRARIGVVDQEGFLFHASVRDNIRHGKPDATDDEVRRAAEAAGVHEFIARLPRGYDTVIGDRGHRLSGGQRQRLAIARAVVRDPEVLILDEATSNLDSRSERLIQESVEQLRGDRTVIAISHRLSTIVMADQILVLDRGRLIESGTHPQLLERNGPYAQLWRLQSETPDDAGGRAA